MISSKTSSKVKTTQKQKPVSKTKTALAFASVVGTTTLSSFLIKNPASLKQIFYSPTALRRVTKPRGGEGKQGGRGSSVAWALYSHKSFFKYRLRVLDDVPFWFAAMLIQLAINGIWLPKLSRLIGESEFSPFREQGRVTWNIPVQYGILFGKNLVLIVGVLFAYLLLKNTYI